MKKSLAVSFLLFLANLGLVGQSFSDYDSAFRIMEFYNAKIVESELRNHIWVLDPSVRATPIFEFYHEAQTYSTTFLVDRYFSNLRFGGLYTWNFPVPGEPGGTGGVTGFSTQNRGLNLSLHQGKEEIKIEGEKDYPPGGDSPEPWTPASPSSSGNGSSGWEYWDLQPSQLSFFSLWNYNYITEPSGLLPILELPAPYFMVDDSQPWSLDSLHGFILRLGRPSDPLLEFSTGLQVIHGPNDWTEMRPNQFSFQVRSPRFYGFLELLGDGLLDTLSLQNLDLFRLGADVITFFGPEDLRWFKRLKFYGDFGNDGLDSLNLRMDRILDLFYLDWHGEWPQEGEASVFDQTRSWRLGLEGAWRFSDELSTVYQTRMDFRVGLSYYNPTLDSRLPLSSPADSDEWVLGFPLLDGFLLTPGNGFQFELVFQNPFSMTVDAFFLLLQLNLALLEIISTGDISDSTLEDIATSFETIAYKADNGLYASEVFSRLTLGYGFNDPGILQSYPFTFNQGRSYIYLSVFF